MRKVIAVDPGTKQSGVVIIHPRTYEIIDSYMIENNLEVIGEAFDQHLNKRGEIGTVVIEQLQPQGKKVGGETFETIYFSGQLHSYIEQRWTGTNVIRIGRKAVLAHHDSLYMAMSNDARIRGILIERFGKEFTRKLKIDCWQAYALGVCHIDRQKRAKK